MNLKKNDIVEIKIEDNGSLGEGIGRIDNFTLFVPESVAGDTLEVKILKIKKSYGHAKQQKIIVPSEARQTPPCKFYSRCGGCNLQHMTYTHQLAYKTKKVREALRRIGGFEQIQVNETLGMDDPFHYRNKAQFPVGEQDGKLAIGFYSPRSHAIIDMDNCLIQHPINQEIIQKIRDYGTQSNVKPYDEATHKGILRHIVTKIGFNTGEIMVCLVINGKRLPHQDQLIESLKSIPGMTSIVVNSNMEKTNVILGDKTETIWGEPHIHDTIADLRFEISPLSFYQVNPVQTNVLYDRVLAFCGLSGTETVLDIFCGIGTISLFLARKAKHVYGIEIVPEAVQDAQRNAAQNDITNTTFLCGDAEAELTRMVEDTGIHADVIVIDPPRKGCDEALLAAIATIKPERLVYVSCDPATLARDLKILCADGFVVEEVQPVDMFSQSVHVETVVLLSRVEK